MCHQQPQSNSYASDRLKRGSAFVKKDVVLQSKINT